MTRRRLAATPAANGWVTEHAYLAGMATLTGMLFVGGWIALLGLAIAQTPAAL